MAALERILDLIESKFGSDAAFERALELKPKTVYEWRRGKSKAYMKMLPQVATALNTSATYLIGEAEDVTIQVPAPFAETMDGQIIPIDANDPEIKRILRNMQDMDSSQLKSLSDYSEFIINQKK